MAAGIHLRVRHSSGTIRQSYAAHCLQRKRWSRSPPPLTRIPPCQCDVCVVKPASDPFRVRRSPMQSARPARSLPLAQRPVQITSSQSLGAQSTAASTPASPCNMSRSSTSTSTGTAPRGTARVLDSVNHACKNLMNYSALVPD